MKEIYRATAGRIHAELRELKQVVERTARIWRQAAVSTDNYYVDATALNVNRATFEQGRPVVCGVSLQ